MDNVKPSSLIDYFFVCGLEYDNGLDSYNMSGDTENSQSFQCVPPLKRSYKPSVLQKFPKNSDELSLQQDYSISSLCMPDGLRLFTPSTVNHEPINHNFFIIHEDNSRIYGTAILFSEEIRNDVIRYAMSSLQNQYRANHQISDGSPLLCKECIDMASDAIDSTRTTISTEFWNEKDKLYALKAIGVLSQHAYIQCHQSWLYDILFMASDLQRLSILKSPSTKSLSDIHLDDITVDFDAELTIESYVYNMLFEINIPERGKSIAINGPSMKHYCRCPDTNDLPIFEFPIRGLLEVLGMENVITLYTCVMLEFRVVIISQDYRLLILVAECITTLLFPFVWPHVYAPILPLAARHFLDAPVPFIMGVKLSNNDEEKINQLASEANVCYVNIDQQTVQSSVDLPVFPYEVDLRREITEILVQTISNNNQEQKSNSRTPNNHQHTLHDVHGATHVSVNVTTINNSSNHELFRHSTYCLSKEAGISIYDLMLPTLAIHDQHLKSEMMAQKYSDMLKNNNIFRELFFNHFLHIFNDYEHFLVTPKVESDMSNFVPENESALQAFDKAGFLSDQPETHLPFLSAFLETQMFTSFIDMKILAAWHPAHSHLMLFERHLRNIQRNSQTQFKSSSNSHFNFKPYFKTDQLIINADKQFAGSVYQMTKSSFNHKFTTSSRNIRINNCKSECCYFPTLSCDRFPMKTIQPSSNITDELVDQLVSQDSQTGMVDHPHQISAGYVKDQVRKLNDLDMLSVQKMLNGVRPLKCSSNIAPTVMAHNDMKFVDTLLQECKAKTKRMILEKMGGHEATALGYCNLVVVGIEENTLVACLCDLLERIWFHGFKGRHGKSALWAHLTRFVERAKDNGIVKQTNKEKSKHSAISDIKPPTNERVKQSLADLGIDRYCLYRYFNGGFAC